MPRQRPAPSGYARLAQADEDDQRNGYVDDTDEEDIFTTPGSISQATPRYAPITGGMHASGQSSPSRHRKRSGTGRGRGRSNSSGVDIKAINARLERWAEEIASKFKISKVKGRSPEDDQLEIHHSVFQPPEGVRPLTAETLADGDVGSDRMTKEEFDDVVESVRVAIENGVHPKMISQGSSGSYFARNGSGKVVGVFKPKDEEPYAVGNPKWTKWIHRNLFPCFFGRECLIPNLSYVSEAAAYVLDSRLRTHIVPYTDVVWLSSKSFHYNFWDRRNYWRGKKQLPAKVGSFQVFLKGFKDANIFLREHPWPDQNTSGLMEGLSKKRKRPFADACKPGGGDQSDNEDSSPQVLTPDVPDGQLHRPFQWTERIKQSFREELEKLVILDYIMRNTDRGLDNWMIKVDYHTEEVSIVSRPPKMNGSTIDPDATPTARPVPVNIDQSSSRDSRPYRRQEAMSAISRSGTPVTVEGPSPTISLGAIDNSLSWPWKHPDAWRSFPFGWLFLPVSLIGQPFSQRTRDHFVPLLTSKVWWSETQLALRRIFSQDADFKESMYARQIAVMKGQAWNVVETLKQADHGPLELTRRARVCVWDDLVEIPVAIPLAKPSAEMQRKREEQEEMDIGAAHASAPNPQHDLLSFGSPTTELPNPNRFELSRDQSSTDLGRINEEVGSPATIADTHVGRRDFGEDIKGAMANSMTLPQRPGAERSKTRFSLEVPRRSGGGQRHHSFSARRGSGTASYFYDGDDLEGDLGYSAAAGMEGQAKKVIVERLETVKSRNPVFNWC